MDACKLEQFGFGETLVHTNSLDLWDQQLWTTAIR